MASRRRFLRGLGAAGSASVLAAGTAGADAAAQATAMETSVAPVDAVRVRGDDGPDDGPTDRQADRNTVLREIGTVTYEDDARRFRFTYEYAIPAGVTELELVVEDLLRSAVSVHDAAHLDRTEETTFVWDGGPEPTLTLDRIVETDVYADNGYATGEAAFAATVRTRVGWRYRETAPAFVREISFDGEGHAGTGWTYAGPFRTELRGTGRTTYTMVLPAESSSDVDPLGVLELYDFADDSVPTLTGYDAASVFVVPTDRLADGFPAGRATANSVLLDDSYATVETVGNVPAHEYVHVQFGDPGDGPMTWLTEGSAEYYGALVSLNAGIGSVEAFLAHVRTEEYADAVLADVRDADDTRADYRKGAHVLAALDAEIRTRSGDEGTLLSVVTSTDHDVETYDGFVAAAVDAAGDDAMADWVEEYVQSSALPTVPDDRRFFVLGDTDPAELPTATPTPSRTPTPDSTPTPGVAGSGTEREDGSVGDGGGDDDDVDGVPVTTPGFGPLAAGAGVALAALLARNREGVDGE